MKPLNYKITLLTVLLSALSLWSCSDDTQSAIEIAISEEVPADIQADFSRSYPEAADVAWTLDNGYAVASFTTLARSNAAHHSSVWYWLNDNLKKMHSAPISFTELPSAVSTAFNTGEYGTLTPCDPAHVITRYQNDSVDCIYVIKAEGVPDGTVSTAVRLYYTEEGTLVKLSSETIYDEYFTGTEDISEFREWLPQPPADFVKAYVDITYPRARYLYIHEGQNFTKVKILDGRIVRTLLFDATGTWTSTATEINHKDIPNEIISAFGTSEFAEWHIHKIIEYSTLSDGHYYLLTLEKEKNKVELRIEADGSVTDAPGVPSDSATPDNTPDENAGLAKVEIEGFILAKYPGASIIKYDYDDDKAQVEINYNSHKIKVRFDLYAQGYVWSRSEWDFDIKKPSALPSVIVKTISDKYSAYRLEYLVYLETADNTSYYEAGLKSSGTKQTIKVKIDVEGNIMAEYGKH